MTEDLPHEVHAAVIGGGVTGLCAAWRLAQAHGAGAVAVLESAAAAGGNVRTEQRNGLVLDWGPNGFLDREPRTLEWIADMGLSLRLIAANEAAAHRFILKNGRLREVVPPPGFLLSPLLSVRGRLRLLCEPWMSPRRDPAPESIWSFAARRIGKEAADTLVTPMVTGIFGGDAKALSLAHCFPRMAAMEREYGSLFNALRARAKARRAGAGAKAGGPMGPGGVLRSFAQGIGELTAHAAQSLQTMGASVHTGVQVTRVTRAGAAYCIETAAGHRIEAAQVVVAAPSHAAAQFTAPLVGEDAARALAAVPYASITVVCTAYRREDVPHPLDGFGFLVPRTEGRRALGCIWSSSLFPQHAPDGWVLLRTMIGGATDPEAVTLSDAELIAIIEREVHPLLDIARAPEAVRIFRHERGIPQYLLNHGEHLAAIEAAEDANPGLVFAGNAYRGVGINDCVVSACRAVEKLPGA